MADYSIKGDTKIDTSGVQSGLSAMTTAAGNLISSCVQTIANGVQDAVKEVYTLGTEFETATAKLATIAGVDAIPGLTEEITALSNETGISAADLADVAYNAISAGVAVEDAGGAAEAASKLATAGFTDTSSALSVLTTAMNAYGDSAGTLEEISDSLIMVQNMGVTTVAELSNSMGKAIASASAYSVNLSNLEAGYISLTKSGISTTESTTYMSAMFKELGDSGSDVGKILKKQTGMSFGQLMESGYSLADVLAILNDSVDGDSEALMNLWSSAEAGKASGAIVNQGLETFNENLNALENSSGATESAYAIMADTMEYKTGVLKTNVQNLSISMYDSFADGLSPIVDFGIDCVQELADGFTQNGVSGLINAAGDVMSQCLSKLAEYLPKIVDIGVELLTSLAEGLINSAPSLIQAAGEIITTLIISLSEKLPDLLSMGAQAVSEIISGIQENLPAALEIGLQVLQSILDGIASGAPDLLNSGLEIVSDLLETVLNSLPDFLDAGFEFLSSMIDGIFENLPNIISTIVTMINNLVNAIVGYLPTFLKKGGEIIIQMIVGLRNSLPDIISGMINILANLISSIKENLPSFLQAGVELILQLGAGLIASLPDLLAKIPQLISSVINLFKATDWREVGVNIIAGIAKGITNGVSSIVNAAKEAAKSALNAAKSFLGIKSPSRKARDEVGVMFDEGIAGGVEDNADQMVDAAVESADQMVDAAQSVVLRQQLQVSDTYSATGSRATAAAFSIESEKSDSITGNDLSSLLRKVLTLLDTYLPDLGNAQVVLDTGKLVGELAPGMDKELGRLSTRRERGS